MKASPHRTERERASYEYALVSAAAALELSGDELADLSNVAIPVNADVPADITVHFVDEYDQHASPIGAKGIGELGATGVDAAVHDAVGVRVRELLILPWKIIEAVRKGAPERG